MSRSPEGKHPGFPGMPGAVPLDGAGRPVQAVRARTERVVTFRGCNAGMFAIMDEEEKVLHYKMIIMDPHENIRYEFDFDNRVRMQWAQDLHSFPGIGEKKPDGE